MKFKEHGLAHELLDGLSGLEIGAAAHNPFGLQTRNVAPLADFEHYADAQEQMGTPPAPVHLWATAESLPVPDGSEDFILSSHVVEHLPNVVTAFLEWDRVVRCGGYVFMIVPVRGALPADATRPITPLEHIVEDYRLKLTVDTHPHEDVPGGRMGHYHVFTPDSLLSVVDWMNEQGLTDWRLAAREDVDTKVGNGFTLAFRIASKPRHTDGIVPKLAPAASDDLEALLRAAWAVLDREGVDEGHQARARNLQNWFRTAREFLAESEVLKKQHNQEEALRQALERQEGETAAVRAELAERQRRLEEMEQLLAGQQHTLGWRALQGLRRVRDAMFPQGGRTWNAYLALRTPLCAMLGLGSVGMRWSRGFRRRAARLGRATEVRRMRREISGFRNLPRISLVMPVYNVAAEWLTCAVESVRRQAYPHWELCLVNDASTDAHVRPLIDRLAAGDPRLRVKHLDRNEGISGASNHALALATGEFVGLLDHDDELTPDALFEVARRLNEDPGLDLLYSDEDKLMPGGACADPVCKPGWNESLLLSCNYITHFSVFRRRILGEVGGFRPAFDGSQDYDLLLRVTERTERIAHIPKVLYHWRVSETSTASSWTAKPYAYSAARRALEEALERRGRGGRAEMLTPGLYRARCPGPPTARASLVVCGPTERWAAAGAGEVIAADGVGAAAANRATRRASGDYLVFLAEGLAPVSMDWLAALLEQVSAPRVGAVGARILGPNGRLEHSGLVLGAGGSPQSASALFSGPSLNRCLYTDLVRRCSAVVDCLLVKREAFDAVKGFDEIYQRDWHDADLCLRLGDAGWATVYTPQAILQQSAAPTRTDSPDRLQFQQRWDRPDPNFSPALLARAA